MKNLVKLGDTIYVPVKIDRIVTKEEDGREKVTYYGGLLKCVRPDNGEIQKILVYLDFDAYKEKNV